MNYIPVEKLKAEIERLNKENNELRKKGGSIGQEFLFGIGAGYADVLKIIESLQQEQPEVDLKKIIEQTYHDGSVADTSDMDHVDYRNIACHFYELGLNAGKK